MADPRQFNQRQMEYLKALAQGLGREQEDMPSQPADLGIQSMPKLDPDREAAAQRSLQEYLQRQRDMQQTEEEGIPEGYIKRSRPMPSVGLVDDEAALKRRALEKLRNR